MTHPDDETVVRVLAERMERTYADYLTSVCSLEDYQQTQRCLISLDALRPVLAKLSDDEWTYLSIGLERDHEDIAVRQLCLSGKLLKAILTLDPPVLARAVAEAILACRKETL